MSSIGSISPLVDSCDKLIHKKALKTFHCISPENKRWVDLEDVIQDGIIEAWEAEQRYKLHASMPKPKSGKKEFHSKYSTYLYRGLDMLFSARYWVPLRQQKRVAPLLELDKPLDTGDGDTYIDLEEQRVSPVVMFQAVSGIVHVCSAVSPAALSFLLAVIVSEDCKLKHGRLAELAGISEACQKFGIRRADFELVLSSQDSKSRVLEGVLRATTKSKDEDVKVLECITCRGMSSLADARAGRYSATSLTCLSCLKKLYATGPENSCFGRLKVVDNNRTVTEGFSEADAECRLHCRDRAACKRFIEEKGTIMAEAVDDMSVDLEDVDFSDIETEADEDAEVDGDETEDADEDEPEEKPAKDEKLTKSAKADKVISGKSAGKAAKKVAAPVKAAATKTAKKVDAAPAKVTGKKSTKPAKAEEKVTKVAKADTKAAAPAKATKKNSPIQTINAEQPHRTRTGKSDEPIDLKVAKAEGLIKLDDKGRDLPFKAASMMRWFMEQCLEPGGASEKMLEKEVMKLAYDYKFQRTVILSGKSGDSSLRPYPSTHVWKTEVEGGKIRVYDVKRVAFYKKLPRIGKTGK